MGALAVIVIAVSTVFGILAINRAADFSHASRASGLITNGKEGIPLTHPSDELSRTHLEDFQAATIPVIPVGPASDDAPFGYEAITAALEANALDSAFTYESSNLVYSAARGAEAARHTAELNLESVLEVVKIGDPYQSPFARGVRDDGASGTGIIRWEAGEEHGHTLDGYYDLPETASSICHGGDPICEFSPMKGLFKLASAIYGDHMDYYSPTRPGGIRTRHHRRHLHLDILLHGHP